MSTTTTTTTTTRDRGDRYGPMEWAQIQDRRTEQKHRRTDARSQLYRFTLHAAGVTMWQPKVRHWLAYIPWPLGMYWNAFDSPIVLSDGRRSWICTLTGVSMSVRRYAGALNAIAHCIHHITSHHMEETEAGLYRRNTTRILRAGFSLWGGLGPSSLGVTKCVTVKA